jgi:hypothetical protein
VVARGSDLVGLLTYMIDGSECEILTLHVDERAQGEAHRSVFGRPRGNGERDDGLDVTVGEAPDGSPRLADVCRLHQFFASITKLVCVATATSADTNPASRNALVRRVGPA